MILSREEVSRLIPDPVVGAAAGFHANPARRRVDEEGQQLRALEWLLHHGLPHLVHSMHLEHILCQINANRRKLHVGRPFRSSGCQSNSLWRFDAASGRGSHPIKLSKGDDQMTTLKPIAPPKRHLHYDDVEQLVLQLKLGRITREDAEWKGLTPLLEELYSKVARNEITREDAEAQGLPAEFLNSDIFDFDICDCGNHEESKTSDKVHRSFLRKQFFKHNDLFTDGELSHLIRYGTWLQALVEGEILPVTDDQRRFIKVAYGRLEPESDFELVWVKFQRLRALSEQINEEIRNVQMERPRIIAERERAEYLERDEAAKRIARSNRLSDEVERNLVTHADTETRG